MVVSNSAQEIVPPLLLKTLCPGLFGSIPSMHRVQTLKVGDEDGRLVGVRVGGLVGDFVGVRVGLRVGVRVGQAVGTGVG